MDVDCFGWTKSCAWIVSFFVVRPNVDFCLLYYSSTYRSWDQLCMYTAVDLNLVLRILNLVSTKIVLLILNLCQYYPCASLSRTLFWNERSAASWHASGIFVLYVYLGVFYRAPRDRDLNSIPKLSWFAASAWRYRKQDRGQPVEFRGDELATSQWEVP